MNPGQEFEFQPRWLCFAENGADVEAGGGGEQPVLPPPSLAGGDDGGDEAEAPAAPPTWREDWRETLAGGDEKRLAQLKRYSTPETFAKSAFSAADRVRQGRAVAPEPPEAATEKEMSDWRKSVGIPETPEGYAIGFPEGVKPSDADKEELGQFMAFMHEKNVRPNDAKAAFEFYMTQSATRAEKMAEAAEEATRESIADLRNAFPGREYRRNVGLANDFLNRHFEGPDEQAALRMMLNTRLENGVKLADYAPFVKAMVAAAREVSSEEAMIGGDGAGGGKSMDDEFKELAALPKLTPEQDRRMVQLAEARIARETRQGRGRAA